MCVLGLSANSQWMFSTAHGAQYMMLAIPDVLIVIQILYPLHIYQLIIYTIANFHGPVFAKTIIKCNLDSN